VAAEEEERKEAAAEAGERGEPGQGEIETGLLILE